MSLQNLEARMYTVGSIISSQQSCEISHISHPFSWMPFSFLVSPALGGPIYVSPELHSIPPVYNMPHILKYKYL